MLVTELFLCFFFFFFVLDCDEEEWSIWSPCSVVCGDGQRRRTRVVNSNSTDCREMSEEEEEPCYMPDCSNFSF